MAEAVAVMQALLKGHRNSDADGQAHGLMSQCAALVMV